MNVLIAVKGAEGEAFFRRAAELAPLRQAERVILAHVVDTGPRRDLEFGRDRFMSRRPLPANRGEELRRAEDERARAGLQYARQVLLASGVAEGVLHEELLQGKPGDVLRDLAEREENALVVVHARSGKPGPHSVGKTARFLIDHAPGGALLIR